MTSADQENKILLGGGKLEDVYVHPFDNHHEHIESHYQALKEYYNSKRYTYIDDMKKSTIELHMNEHIKALNNPEFFKHSQFNNNFLDELDEND